MSRKSKDGGVVTSGGEFIKVTEEEIEEIDVSYNFFEYGEYENDNEIG